MDRIRIIVIGGTKRAIATFENILARNDVKIEFGIFMNGYIDEEIYANKLAHLAKENNILSVISDKITLNIIEKVQSIAPCAIICIGVWRSILRPIFWESSKYGCLCLHATPLPRYRGWAGINWQIINGEKYITARMFKMNDGIDSGPLVCDEKGNVLEYKIPIDNEKHLQEIFDDYQKMHIKAFHNLLNLITNKKINFIEQDHSQATYTCHRGPDDGEINWNNSTKDVFNFIRAQSKPYGGAFTYFDNEKVTTWRAKPRYDYNNYSTGKIPGKVAYRNKQTGCVIILTQDGGIELLDVEKNNQKKNTPFAIFNSLRKTCQSKIEAFMNKLIEQ